MKKASVKIKTLRIRAFPNDTEKAELKLIFEQFRWYYNATLDIFGHISDDDIKSITYKNHVVATKLRDLIRKYEYVEQPENNVIVKKFVRNEDRNAIPDPKFWDKVHSRIPRGASDKFTSSINAAISNEAARNIKSFEMKPLTKKDDTMYVHFEDGQYPAFINKIKSRYWFTTQTNKGRHRASMSLNDIINDSSKRGLELTYDKTTDKYFILFPVDRNWLPKDDKRIEIQNASLVQSNRVISLDPGVRKFLVGYDPAGKVTYIGNGASKELASLLLALDKTPNKRLQYMRIKNLVDELHWKTINYLMRNYDHIILPDFRISSMVKSITLPKIVKRLMYAFSYHSFKLKLMFKCENYGKKLYIVNEAYTSKTCGECGLLNNVGTNEVFKCSDCMNEIDRDAAAARNIFIKNVSLR